MTTYQNQTLYTAHAPGEPEPVDANGDPRFVTERDMAEANSWQQEDDDERAQEAMWEAEQDEHQRLHYMMLHDLGIEV